MSKEIKFRAWDNANNEWLNKEDAECLTMYLDGRYEIDRGWVKVFPDLIIEQYTGSTDKNGKEIYEGDIVREDVEVGDDDIDGEYRYQVVWDEETLCWSLSPNYGTIHKDLWETNLSREVIGNIHEPPKDFRPEHLKRMGVSINKGEVKND